MGAPSGSEGYAGDFYPEGYERANHAMVVLGGQPVCFLNGLPYLNCEIDPQTGQPLHDPMAHVYRQGDPKPDFEHRGLLTQISEDDLKDTDLYVFRTATGDLVLKREGLEAGDIDAEAGGFVLDIAIPGGGAYAAWSAGPGGSNLEAWQTSLGLEDDYVGRLYNLDSLRPGESVTQHTSHGLYYVKFYS